MLTKRTSTILNLFFLNIFIGFGIMPLLGISNPFKKEQVVIEPKKVTVTEFYSIICTAYKTSNLNLLLGIDKTSLTKEQKRELKWTMDDIKFYNTGIYYRNHVLGEVALGAICFVPAYIQSKKDSWHEFSQPFLYSAGMIDVGLISAHSTTAFNIYRQLKAHKKDPVVQSLNKHIQQHVSKEEAVLIK